MTTEAPDQLRAFARDVEDIPELPSAVNSGIVGDLAHRLNGGYHISIEDQPSDNYSVIRVNDKAPPGNWPRNLAAAVDTSMSTADMVRTWNRVYAVWAARGSDPRAKYFNAFNGWNGVGEAERLDFVTGSRTIASPDHKWHSHDETPRRYVNDAEMRRAKRSVYRGETVQQYLFGNQTSQGGNMAGRLVVIKDTSNQHWACDGIWRTAVSPAAAASIAGPGNANDYLGAYVGIQNFGTTPAGMDAWGRDTATAAAVGNAVVSPTQIDQIANAAAAAVVERDDNPLGDADKPAIVEAVKTALREGTAS